MTRSEESSGLERFAAVVSRGVGLRFEPEKLAFLGELLQRRAALAGCRPEVLLQRLEAGPARAEWAALAPELTISESHFFRNAAQFEALAQLVLPERARVRAASRELYLLSAGCAGGEEAYTLAILTRDLVHSGWQVCIRAVDLNPLVLARAARGHFSTWALRETPAAIRERWFRPLGGEFALDSAVCAAVRFEQGNLAEENGDLWLPRHYDVVFCRNTLMYFTPESMRAVVARIARSLAPGGYVFLGHAETLRGLSQDFHLRHSHEAFYYQRKGGACADAPLAAGCSRAGAPLAAADAAAVPVRAHWVEAVEQAARRIRSLAQRRAEPEPGAADAPAAQLVPVSPAIGADPDAPRGDLGEVFELLRAERFAEALERIRAVPKPRAEDPEVMLVHAALLAHSGDLAHSEQVCRQLLEIDELHSGAHYVLALCRAGRADRRGAVEHHQLAVHLDPRFAMPRLHLGLLARRAGDVQTARRELEPALALLEGEDDARLLLFGGGFNRAALIDLCRSQLLACGGAA